MLHSKDHVVIPEQIQVYAVYRLWITCPSFNGQLYYNHPYLSLRKRIPIDLTVKEDIEV